MPKPILVLMIILGVVATAGCRRLHEALPVMPAPDRVPETFQMTYRELDAEFQRQLPLIQLPWGQKTSRTAFGVDLLVANRLRGEVLGNDPVMETRALMLDRLKALGVGCVSLNLQYPLLTRAHPRTPEYRAFYRGLAVEIRRRGLAIVAEIGSGSAAAMSRQTEADLRGLNRNRFNRGLREMAEAVIADIRPDHLTLLSEPDTQTRNTGLTFSPAEFAATVKHVARDLKPPGIRIGAGAGTWTALEYFKALAAIPELDYLDLHIAPIQHGFAAERALKAAEIARSSGKGISIGAAWLYKVWGQEFDRIPPVEAFSRDVYSFWQPLDEHFVGLTANLAHGIQAEFCSFFGTTYLFGYLDFTADTGRLQPAELARWSDQAADESIRKGTLSATGQKFGQVIKP